MKTLFSALVLLMSVSLCGQDTFSIVALDPETGEVGSAGASCVDLFQTGLNDDHFLGQLFPGLGAINTQAWYIPANQNNAAGQMLSGNSPQEIIDWLVENDIEDAPEFRQYGIVGYENEVPVSAGYTGASTDDYKNHITGPDYCIQGNILLGQEVLDSMEARFLAEEGDLACKLMAALQGANMVGADTRCTTNGTSSLFAFLQVAQPNDANLDPSLVVSVRTHDGAGIEPIDSLQTKFDLVHSCGPAAIEEFETTKIQLYPNPVREMLNVRVDYTGLLNYIVRDATGIKIDEGEIKSEAQISMSAYAKGAYTLTLFGDSFRQTQSFIKE